MTPTNFGKAIPVLASLNMARTLAFYADVLGFTTHHVAGHTYGIVVRGDAELHFWHSTDPHIAENTSCYLRVDNIEAVYQELSPRLPTLQPVVHTAWGMGELYVIDPDGNLIKFGQESAAG